MGENIADLGGVNIAFDALQMYLKDKGNPGKISGFDQNQSFFLSWATCLENQRNREIHHIKLKTDPHLQECTKRISISKQRRWQSIL